MKTATGCATVMLCLAAASAVTSASPPGLVNYQGVLRDAAEAPVTASLDMVFHLYDAAAAGNEILVDRHLAGSTGGVEVAGGLFNVALGGGSVEDGSGPGSYTSLAEVFRDFAEVYLEVEIETPMGFETLAPRTRIVSAAYSLSAGHASTADSATNATHATNADNAANATSAADSNRLAGLDGAQFLRSDTSDSFAAGTLTLAAGTSLNVHGSLFSIGPLRVGTTSPVPYNHFGAVGTPSTGLMTSSADVYVQGDLEIDDALHLNGVIHMDDNGPNHDQTIYFWASNSKFQEYLSWDDDDSRFAMSDDLVLSGNLYAGGLYTELMSLNFDGPEGSSAIYFFEDGSSFGEELQWNNVSDRFNLSDTLNVAGDLDATGAKLFIQNHPYRSDLSVAYVALEGDEAATFTRGFGRLVDGKARVVLGETFALVTNPEIGLTAHLTPRGEWAELYVESLTPSEMVVGAAPGSPRDVVFDYIVFGLRIGYEDHRALRPRQVDSPVPFAGHYERLYPDHPELRTTSALRRYRGMSEAAGISVGEEMPATLAMRRGIGEHDPEASSPVDLEPAEAPPKRPDAGAFERSPEPPVPDGSSATAASRAMRAGGPVPEIAGPEVATRAAELAITMPVAAPIEAGDVLVVSAEGAGPLRAAERAADPGVAGVVAEVLRSADGARSAETEGAPGLAAVVVAGVASCKVDASYGEIHAGDLLTTSPTPGHAMRAAETAPGTIVGKALEPLAVRTGTIQVLVMLR